MIFLIKNIKIEKFQVEMNTNVNYKIMFDYCVKNDEEGLKTHIQSGMNMNIKIFRQRNLLHIAACYNSVECMEVLIDAGLDIDEKTSDGKTPLHDSVENRSPGCLHLLLKAGADVNAKDKYGRTPLHQVALIYLSKMEALCFAKIFLYYGADPTIKNNVGKTFLDYIQTKDFRKEIEEYIQELSSLDIKEPQC